MVGRVGLKLQEVAPSRAYAPNPLDLRSGRSESPASQPRASRVRPSNPTRPARSHLWSHPHVPLLTNGEDMFTVPKHLISTRGTSFHHSHLLRTCSGAHDTAARDPTPREMWLRDRPRPRGPQFNVPRSKGTRWRDAHPGNTDDNNNFISHPRDGDGDPSPGPHSEKHCSYTHAPCAGIWCPSRLLRCRTP
jgi:hypothetical protein